MPPRAMRVTSGSAEEAEVAERVTLRAGSVTDLDAAAFGQIFDTVLLLGVLMYLPASQPVIAGLAARVAPGGFLAVAARTVTSALWRPDPFRQLGQLAHLILRKPDTAT